MGIVKSTNEIYVDCPTDYSFERGLHIPAWSLHRLMEIYTNGFSDSNWNMAQFNWNILIDCIECRIHEGYCNKEYLEQ